jgi:hypothetical protein
LNDDGRPAHFDTPSGYEIRVEGRVSASWSDRLGGMTIAVQRAGGRQPVTTLTGELRDQSALLGVLSALYNMGFPLLKVERLESPPSAGAVSR